MNRSLICLGILGLTAIICNNTAPFTVQDAVQSVGPHSHAMMYCLGNGHKWDLHHIEHKVGHYDKWNGKFVGPTLEDQKVDTKNICDLCRKVDPHITRKNQEHKHRHYAILHDDIKFVYNSDGIFDTERIEFSINCT